MGIKVCVANEADMDRLFEITSLAFERNEPVWDAMYPSHWTAEGRKHGAERLRDVQKSDPHATFLKAVDDETGEIAGMAKWLIFQSAFPDSITLDAKYWPTEADYKYYQDMVPIFLSRRNEALKRTNGNLVSLDLLTVDPVHQNKGVGQALVEWGTAKADSLDLEAVVESSVFGKRLYEKNGFVFKEQVEVAVPGEIDRAPGAFAWLERPKRSSKSSVWA
ncbi:hypothetical protein CLAFUW4_00979 [Fulvia fulva]|uniref:N-acetyltransferase domain-containing protein n=1 Tax=Passalora fulva TaxID=5499 RepID=A0A9Q8L5X6_PASFU|nr:uncharacterized protein CLAFUR5_00985 [Fulvia fulva]KAK4635009.1 hypothetical protein CLAFUR4_00980 [Fulvia fulva]KAK4636512.1 hypothetical protein CLAFUR0_00981 [Fulvia fulva]UJO10808.1 hypothetical protein CLAFUR5_00985 [Fulvia fulva]WPV08568.1 hypothetical protein CLAFUW4_00979 [Fulvia fulva]WPV24034.1 hypothetical protein CLAFUW7_00837 [Fulvia fulva]